METKYSISYTEIENSLKDSEQNLASLIDQLTGDENAINGLSNLIKK
jgi:type I restriction enzyme M protein